MENIDIKILLIVKTKIMESPGARMELENYAECGHPGSEIQMFHVLIYMCFQILMFCFISLNFKG